MEREPAAPGVKAAERKVLAGVTVPRLGADGFGFSDTRPAARRFFTIDGPSVVVRTLQQLARRGVVDPAVVGQAIERYRLHDVTAGTTGAAGGDA